METPRTAEDYIKFNTSRDRIHQAWIRHRKYINELELSNDITLKKQIDGLLLEIKIFQDVLKNEKKRLNRVK